MLCYKYDDPHASFDFNDHFDDQHDPVPDGFDENNGHGTKCAGEVAMEANNSFCGVGIAYDAKIGGFQAQMEGSAGSEMQYYKHIKSRSETMGRNGKGSIFIWASGNGGLLRDHCGADGYVNSIFTVAVGAVSNFGLSTFYSEACPAVMAVVPTGGTSNSPLDRNVEEQSLVTTELDNECTKTFRGTSSAAPMAAGIIALVLQAIPSLTWRDVQHLIVRTAKMSDLMNKGWKINGAGYHIHHK
ncbi:hypothetical protein scyTo_0000370 [Scyliorhinus torazame]|uniref:Peptidase S8/S53 domain-containing protein n=1 Tax=Scyliorhinus torazame TaxID=75743 RepID=A0A401NVZ3_SCYTO|nr:hypothetical protein [Scyliorhinus torazame]